jgi:hypothetical protein
MISKSDYQFLNPGGVKKYYIAVSLLSRNNNEGEISNIITATKGENGGWDFNN